MSAFEDRINAAKQRAHEKMASGDDDNVVQLLPPMITSDVLMGMTFDPLKYIVADILCEGLTILAGRPKIGKSWIALDTSVAVATGGLALDKFRCEPGDVLLLALEDSRRRLKSRLEKIGFAGHRRLTLSVTWPRIDQGGLDAIAAWLGKHPDARLVIIDTLTKVRPAGIPNRDLYQADSDSLKDLHRFANDRGIAIVVVHHTRKMASDDWLDSVSGTTGLTGVADSTIVLKRERGQADAFLFGTGRDLPDYELPLKFDEATARWQVLDMSAAEAQATSGQSSIIEALRKVLNAGLTRGQIATMTDRSKEATSNMLSRMELAGIVERKGSMWFLTIG